MPAAQSRPSAKHPHECQRQQPFPLQRHGKQGMKARGKDGAQQRGGPQRVVWHQGTDQRQAHAHAEQTGR